MDGDQLGRIGPQRSQNSKFRDVWIEIYSPDIAVVEETSRRVSQWCRDAALQTSGPSKLRQTRLFSLRDTDDLRNGAEEQRLSCLVHKIGVFGMSADHVVQLKQFQVPKGVRLRCCTRTPWKPLEILVHARSVWTA